MRTYWSKKTVKRNILDPKTVKGNIVDPKNTRDYNVEIKVNRNGKPKKAFINDHRFKPNPRFREYTLGKKVLVVGDIGARLLVSAGAGVYCYELGNFVSSYVDMAKSTGKLAKDIYEKGVDVIYYQILQGEDNQVIKSIDQLIISGNSNIDQGLLKEYKLKFSNYKSISEIFNKAQANIDNAFRNASKHSKNLTPDILVTDSIFEQAMDWIHKKSGNYSNPEDYENANQQVIKQRKELYEVLEYSSKHVSDELLGSKSNLGNASENMVNFNEAYNILAKEDEMIKTGLEFINAYKAEINKTQTKYDTTKLDNMQKEIDNLKPFSMKYGIETLPITMGLIGGVCTYMILNKIKKYTYGLFLK